MPLIAQDSFGAIAFDLLDDGYGRTAEAKVSVHLVPGGDLVYEDRAGRADRLLSCTLYLPDQATLEALEAVVGDQDFLAFYDGSYLATLLSLSADTVYEGGSRKVRAEFRLV